MMNSSIGRDLVKLYYLVSPRIARRIERDRYLRAIVSAILKFTFLTMLKV